MLQSKQLIQENNSEVILKQKTNQSLSINTILYTRSSVVQKLFQTTIPGELAKRVIKRVKDDGGRDTKSHILKHNI